MWIILSAELLHPANDFLQNVPVEDTDWSLYRHECTRAEWLGLTHVNGEEKNLPKGRYRQHCSQKTEHFETKKSTNGVKAEDLALGSLRL